MMMMNLMRAMAKAGKEKASDPKEKSTWLTLMMIGAAMAKAASNCKGRFGAAWMLDAGHQ